MANCSHVPGCLVTRTYQAKDCVINPTSSLAATLAGEMVTSVRSTVDPSTPVHFGGNWNLEGTARECWARDSRIVDKAMAVATGSGASRGFDILLSSFLLK
eukprot:SAG31_NODE_30884_length_375_cov_0.561594_1_plen_100_part_01